MKIKKDFMLKMVAGEYVVVPVGEKVVDFTAMISLNETAAFIWNVLQEESQLEDVVDALTKEYDIAAEKAQEDVLKFIDKLKAADLLE